MTAEEIIQGNKLIADSPFSTDGIKLAVKEDAEIYNRLRYHLSWDWLMPVWEKLRYNVFTNLGGYSKEFMIYIENYKTACFNNSIGDAFYAVKDGIQWYNQQTPNP